MSDSDIVILKIYVLLSPLLVAAAALAAVWIGDWLNRRERPHQAAE